MVKQFNLTAVSSMLAGLTLMGPGSVLAVADIDVLPDAKSGECYAKVLVPPVYKTESIETVVSESTERLQIIPATYASDTERVLIKQASTQLTTIEPEYKTVKQTLLVSPQSRQWVRGSVDSGIAASPGLLADLSASGVAVGNVSPGTCFFEHYKPAVYKTSQDKVLIAAATEKLETLPAEFTTSEKQVLVKAASKRLIVVPAVFKSVNDKILVEPGKSIWKKGTGPIQRIDNTTGEIMCRIDIPAIYENYTKRVVAAPPLTTNVVVPAEFTTVKVETVSKEAQEVRTPVPAQYEMISKRTKMADGKFSWASGAVGDVSVLGAHTGTVVCHTETAAEFEVVEQVMVKTPGRFDVIPVPAVYKNVSTQKLISDAMVKRTPILEEKKSFIKRIKVSDARQEWRPVLCETNMGDDTIENIQQALADSGYSPGIIDGVLGRGTMDALSKFQKEKNLPQGGITYPTLEALGIKL